MQSTSENPEIFNGSATAGTLLIKSGALLISHGKLSIGGLN
jgi:hypothetical protein